MTKIFQKASQHMQIIFMGRKQMEDTHSRLKNTVYMYKKHVLIGVTRIDKAAIYLTRLHVDYIDEWMHFYFCFIPMKWFIPHGITWHTIPPHINDNFKIIRSTFGQLMYYINVFWFINMTNSSLCWTTMTKHVVFCSKLSPFLSFTTLPFLLADQYRKRLSWIPVYTHR